MPSDESRADESRATLSWRVWAVVAALVVLTVVAYYRVAVAEFIPFDDPKYVYENPRIKQGLTLDNIIWGLTAGHFGGWHPLTWWSYFLDGQLFSAVPGAMHLVNLVIHVANSALLFLVLRRMTGGLWQSAMVAMLFALHPLHVESVAWISERKDVLSALFWILTLGAYARYAERPSWGRYGVVCLTLALGLMSKAMVVTLPCVLLLLDYWPLRRSNEPTTGLLGTLRQAAWLTFEKIPLFILVALAAAATFIGQRNSGTMANLDRWPLILRVSNACVSYIAYLGKMFWPTRLAVFYPHPATIQSAGGDLTGFYWQAAAAAALLVVVTVCVLWLAPRRRYLLVGWLWYLGTLVPVIGLVQVGWQAMADRYMYIPLIGPAIMLAWGVPELLARVPQPRQKAYLAAMGTVTTLICLAITWRQVGYWRNGIELGLHAIAVTKDNYQAHGILAMSLTGKGYLDDAIRHGNMAIELSPPGSFYTGVMHSHLGAVHMVRREAAEAKKHLEQAVKIAPDLPAAHYNLGSILADEGKFDAAIVQLQEALRQDPYYARAHYALGQVYLRQEKFTDAERHFSTALQLDPQNPRIRDNLQRSRDAQAGIKISAKDA